MPIRASVSTNCQNWWGTGTSMNVATNAHGPAPVPHVACETVTDQHWRVPTSIAAWSRIRSRHVPLAAGPDLSMNAARGCSGRKVPANGATPAAMAVAAASSKMVRVAQVAPP